MLVMPIGLLLIFPAVLFGYIAGELVRDTDGSFGGTAAAATGCITYVSSWIVVIGYIVISSLIREKKMERIRGN